MWELIIAQTLAELLLSDKPDKVKELRMTALQTLRKQLNYYKELGFIDRLLTAIAEKKCKFLMEITSKTEMEKNAEAPLSNIQWKRVYSRFISYPGRRADLLESDVTRSPA